MKLSSVLLGGFVWCDTEYCFVVPALTESLTQKHLVPVYHRQKMKIALRGTLQTNVPSILVV